jgi:hypothetical protein
MASQQSPTPTPTTVEAGSESHEQRLSPDESVTLDVKEEEDLEASPAIPTAAVDDFPDGGLAAWSIVLGVSELTIPSSSNFLIIVDRVVYVCHFRNVGCIRQAWS